MSGKRPRSRLSTWWCFQIFAYPRRNWWATKTFNGIDAVVVLAYEGAIQLFTLYVLDIIAPPSTVLIVTAFVVRAIPVLVTFPVFLTTQTLHGLETRFKCHSCSLTFSPGCSCGRTNRRRPSYTHSCCSRRRNALSPKKMASPWSWYFCRLRGNFLRVRRQLRSAIVWLVVVEIYCCSACSARC